MKIKALVFLAVFYSCLYLGFYQDVTWLRYVCYLIVTIECISVARAWITTCYEKNKLAWKVTIAANGYKADNDSQTSVVVKFLSMILTSMVLFYHDSLFFCAVYTATFLMSVSLVYRREKLFNEALKENPVVEMPI